MVKVLFLVPDGFVVNNGQFYCDVCIGCAQFAFCLSGFTGSIGYDRYITEIMRQANNQAAGGDVDLVPTAEGPAERQMRPSKQNGPHRRIRAQQVARQAVRMRRFLVACLFAVLYTVAISAFYAQGLMTQQVFISAIALVSGMILVFYLVFVTGINQKAVEKSLTVPLTACSLAIMLWMVYCAPPTRIIFAPFAALTIAYAMYRLSQKTVLALSLGTLASYAVIIGIHYQQSHSQDLLRIESLHWLVLMLALPGFVVLTGRVQRLHGALYKASLRIRNIEENSRRDSLTNCYNRRYMVAALEEQKRLADETGLPLCLALIDLDHFKRINDEVGHLAGDEVLCAFAMVAQANIRDSDIFGRYGGEEFLLVLPATSLHAALNTAERIRAQIEQYRWNVKLQDPVTVSIGLTQYITSESILDLFDRADTAMYLAKRGGRNQVVVEEPTVELWQAIAE
jgi:diguanylate cyclase (GGDEF)-like protein